MHEKISKVQDSLAVEIAVKIREELNRDDEDVPIYEYLSEAREVVNKIEQAAELKESPKKIADIITATLSNSLEFNYQQGSFLAIGKFIASRYEQFKKTYEDVN